MQINVINSVNFQRRLKTSEEADFCNTLKEGRKKAGNLGKAMLIIPTPSLPQAASNNTGVGNLGNEDGLNFLNFAKKYWGINEIQILPAGQYHEHKGGYPVYSGTSMDLGNHLINIKDFATQDEYNEIVKFNDNPKRVNYKNVVDKNSAQEKILKKIFERTDGELLKEFEAYKKENAALLEPKGLYRALREINSHYDYKEWPEIDKNLFNENIVSGTQREKRISEIYKQEGREIDFYKFKQFLAEKSLKNAKTKLNEAGLKLSGDMICGFSYDEVWANPKAFRENYSIGWGLPALNFDTPEAEKLLRQKVNIYSKRFDGFRIDASWTYVCQNLKNTKTGEISKKDYGDKILKIIDDEVKKVKGANFDLKNITHEFATSSDQFNIFNGSGLKPYLKDRVKIYTSEWLSSDWGSNQSFLKRGWDKESFIIGATNHDSHLIIPSDEQANTLSKILNIPKEKLVNTKEFVKAKLAEPMSAFNNMIFFTEALGIKEEFQHNSDKALNYTTKISENYEKEYFSALENGEAFNPMDALEKTFKARGLDKEEPVLYKKIVKYRKVLESKEKAISLKWAAGAAALLLTGIALYKYCTKEKGPDNS